NLGSLIRILNHQSFLDGRASTAFLSDFADDILPDRAAARQLTLAAFAATVAEIDGLHQSAHVGSGTPAVWRNVVGGPILETFSCGEQELVLSYLYSRSGLRLVGEDDVSVLRCDQNSVVLEIDGVQKRYSISWYGDQAYVTDAEQPIILNRTPRYTDPADQIAEGSLTAPMPGAVLRIAYSVGDRVEAGKPIMWLEAMKMEHQVLAPYSGVIAELPAQTGAQVEVGTILVVLEEESADKESRHE
ncbi:MAG: biotin/lipoyl-containing protein, partial [Antricoccus sp.]